MKPLILRPDTTILDIVGHFQEEYRGYNTCAVVVCEFNGLLWFVECEYHPLADNDVPRYVKVVSGLCERFCVFEHFLQSVRTNHPGISFQELVFQSDYNWQRVFKRTYHHHESRVL